MGHADFLYIENCAMDDAPEVLSILGETPTNRSRPASDWEDAESFEYEHVPLVRYYQRRIVAQHLEWLVLTGYAGLGNGDEQFEGDSRPYVELSRRFGGLVLVCMTQGTVGWESLYAWRAGHCVRRYEQLEDEVLADFGERLEHEPPPGKLLEFWEACDVGDKLVGFGIEHREASRIWAYETQTAEDLEALTRFKAEEALRQSKRPWWKFW